MVDTKILATFLAGAAAPFSFDTNIIGGLENRYFVKELLSQERPYPALAPGAAPAAV